ncbi:MAG: hypothetical protein ACREXR_02560 [Gammaproteobacteria bacterium]
MTEYRRAYVPGAAWFFTVNLAERKGNRLLVKRIETLRERSSTSAVDTLSVSMRW